MKLIWPELDWNIQKALFPVTFRLKREKKNKAQTLFPEKLGRFLPNSTKKT